MKLLVIIGKLFILGTASIQISKEIYSKNPKNTDQNGAIASFENVGPPAAPGGLAGSSVASRWIRKCNVTTIPPFAKFTSILNYTQY